jgi:hypothetical protein
VGEGIVIGVHLLAYGILIYGAVVYACLHGVIYLFCCDAGLLIYLAN